ncbi:unnamed protein product [Boreogadus saida]
MKSVERIQYQGNVFHSETSSETRATTVACLCCTCPGLTVGAALIYLCSALMSYCVLYGWRPFSFPPEDKRKTLSCYKSTAPRSDRSVPFWGRY